MRSLPQVSTLQDAVKLVVASNSADGYNPARFIQATGNGYAENLALICERLIVRGETLEYLESALRRYPTLLTLEDFISRFGGNWGFTQEVIQTAQARVSYFDSLVGMQRYE